MIERTARVVNMKRQYFFKFAISYHDLAVFKDKKSHVARVFCMYSQKHANILRNIETQKP